MSDYIYADHAATTSLSPAALDAMMPYLTGNFGNPSSLHTYGEEAGIAVAESRSALAELLGCEPEEIIFTSGGSEADNHAMLILEHYGIASGKRTLLISGAEHHAVLSPAEALVHRGIGTVKIHTDPNGTVSPERVRLAAESAEGGIVGGSFMLVNNETGSIFGICEISEIIHSYGGYMHTDAVQAAGHVPVSFRDTGADMLSLSAHKFHGPKGVGALICRKGTRIPSFIKGGSQERGRRAGTENVAGIVGMTAALGESVRELDTAMRHVSHLREMLLCGLRPLGAAENGGGVPGILSVRFPNADGEALVRSLDLLGIAASAGAACNSKEVGVSHVLLSMGLSEAEAASTVRFSLDRSNTEEEVRRIVSAMTELLS